MAQASRDQNNVPTLLAASNVDGVTPVRVYADPTSHRLLVDISGGSGTVTSFSFTDGNGFDGTVTNPTTTPNLSLAITVSGMLKGVTGAITQAVANTDYQSPIALTTTGTSGAATFNGTTLNIPNYATGSGVVQSVVGTSNRITVNSTDPANPVVDIAATYVGQTSITTLGTIATGTWNGTAIAGQYGGTGVANTGKTITLGGNLTTSGAFASTFTMTNTTTVTFPTTGTLATTTDIANMVTAAATFATDESILRADGTGRGAQATSTNATLTDAGALTLAGLATATGFSPTATTATGNRLYLPAANTLGLAINGTGAVQLTATVLSPVTNDGVALGSTTLNWADLFLASGAVINFANSNVVLTHSSGILTLTTGTLALGANNLTMTGSIAATGARVTKGWFTDIESTNAPTVGGTALPTATSTTTITNKRNQPRTASSTTSSNLSPDLSTANVYYRTTQTATLTIDAPTGTPVIGEVIVLYVDSAGAQTLTINATYKAFGAAFPAATTAGKTFMLTAQYNGTDWKSTWANAV